MPTDVAAKLRNAGLLRSDGPHAPSTVKRRLASWGTLLVEREGGAVPLTQSALRAPTGGPGQHPATAAEQQAGGHPRCTRSSPLYLPVGPAGRYPRSRHPAAGLRFRRAPPQRGGSAAGRAAQRRNGALDPRDPKSERLPCSAIQLGRTKTGVADEAERVLLVGPPVEALRKWLERVDVSSGPIFRSIDHWEALEERALTPQSISLIVKRRCASPGWRQEFSVHGLRSDYLTEAWCLLTRGDATVAASLGAAGSQLLQRGRSTTRSSCTASGLNGHGSPRPNLDSACGALEWGRLGLDRAGDSGHFRES